MIIEQDRTFHIDPACQQNGAGGSSLPTARGRTSDPGH